MLPKHSGTSAFRSISSTFGKGIHRAAKLSSRNPIEMIAGILILSSFSYFYLFNLARTSDIFSGTVTRLYPTLVYATVDSDFEPLTRHLNSPLAPEAIKIQLKQISITDKEKNLIDRATLASILEFQAQIQHGLLDDSLRYNALCFKDVQGECFSSSISSIFDLDSLSTQDLRQAIQAFPELSQVVFGELDLNASTASSVLMSFAFNASTSYRQELSHLWEQKVSTYNSGNLVSLSNNVKEDAFTWIFIITRNIIIRIKELIEVTVYLYCVTLPNQLTYN